MQINKIEIENFGKLTDFYFEPVPGFQLVLADNESGKSTLLAFVRAAFYGLARNDYKNILNSDRTRYRPWNKARMAGAIEFSHEGEDYRLTCVFGESVRYDEINLFSKTSGEKIDLQKASVGEKILNTSQKVFDKTVFVSQMNTVLPSNAADNGDLVAKLTSLSRTGDLDTSYDLVNNRLLEADRFLTSSQRKRAVIPALQLEIKDLEQQEVEAEERRAEAWTVQQKMTEMQEELEADKQRLQASKTRLLYWEDLEQADHYWQHKAEEAGLQAEARALHEQEQFFANQQPPVDQESLENWHKELVELASRSRELIWQQDQASKQAEILAVKQEEVLAKEQMTELSRLVALGETLDQVRVKEGEIDLAIQAIRAEIDSLNAKNQKQELELRERINGLRSSYLNERNSLQERHNTLISDKQKEEATGLTLAAQSRKVDEKINGLEQEALEASRAIEELDQAAKNDLKAGPQFQVFNFWFGASLVNLLLAAGLFIGLGDRGGLAGFICLGLGLACGVGFLFDRAKKVRIGRQLAQARVDQARQKRAELESKQFNLRAEREALVSERGLLAEKIRVNEQSLSAYRDKLRASDQQLTLLADTFQARTGQLEAELAGWVQVQTQSPDQQKLAADLDRHLREKAELGADRVQKKEELAGKLADWGLCDPGQVADLLRAEQVKEQRIEELGAQIEKAETDIQSRRADLLAATQAFFDQNSLCRSLAGAGFLSEDYDNPAHLEQELQHWIAKLAGIDRDYREFVRRSRALVERQETLAVGSRDKLRSESLGRVKQAMAEEGLAWQEEAFRHYLAEKTGGEGRPDWTSLLAAYRSKQEDLQTVVQELSLAFTREKTAYREKYSQLINPDSIRRELAEKRADLAAASQRHKLLQLAQDLLRQADHELQRQFSPGLQAQAASYLQRLTGDKYEGVLVDKNFNLHVKEAGQLVDRQAEYLSGGSYDQVYLALRLALAKLLDPEANLPLLLDDVLVQYDDRRAAAGLELLAEIAREDGRQILLFSCQSAHYRMASELEAASCKRDIF